MYYIHMKEKTWTYINADLCGLAIRTKKIKIMQQVKAISISISANVRFPSWVTDSALSCAPWDVSGDIKSDNKNLTVQEGPLTRVIFLIFWSDGGDWLV